MNWAPGRDLPVKEDHEQVGAADTGPPHPLRERDAGLVPGADLLLPHAVPLRDAAAVLPVHRVRLLQVDRVAAEPARRQRGEGEGRRPGAWPRPRRGRGAPRIQSRTHQARASEGETTDTVIVITYNGLLRNMYMYME